MMGHATLRTRILLAQVALVLLVTATGLVAVRLLTPVFFERGLQNRGGSLGGPDGSRWSGSAANQNLTVSAEIQDAYNDALTKAAIIAGIAGLIAALILGILFTRQLLQRLGEVQHAAHRLAAGDYRSEISPPPEPELADLAVSINTLGATLAATEETRARLMSDVAHEIRNPLTTIEGYMEGLIDGVLPPTVETYTEVADEAHRVKLITDDLSFMSKAQEGVVRYEAIPFDLSELAHSAVERLRPRCDARGVTLQQSLDTALPVTADADRMTQALANLFTNALAHTPEGGTISVVGRRQAGECEIAVSDTGDGIPAEHLDIIFERFTRFRDGPGIGIGLNIARSIAEGHHGSLTAQSEGPGRGATFTLALPEAAS